MLSERQSGNEQPLSQHVRLRFLLDFMRAGPGVEETIQIAMAIYATDKAPKRMLQPRKMKVYARFRPPYILNAYAWRPQFTMPKTTSIHTSAVPQTIRHFWAVVITE